MQQLEQATNPTEKTTDTDLTLRSYITNRITNDTNLSTEIDDIPYTSASVQEGAVTIADNQSFELVDTLEVDTNRNTRCNTVIPYTAPPPPPVNNDEEALIDRILSYTGDPADWFTLEFKVLCMDGEIWWHHYPSLSTTAAFDTFQTANPELSILKPLSKYIIRQYDTSDGLNNY
jgi:hypothetical protein